MIVWRLLYLSIRKTHCNHIKGIDVHPRTLKKLAHELSVSVEKIFQLSNNMEKER